MVPGFLIVDTPETMSGNQTHIRVALASEWDTPTGAGKVCSNPYTNTNCVLSVLWCQNCRRCRRSDSYTDYEDCGWWYACGVCTGGWG